MNKSTLALIALFAVSNSVSAFSASIGLGAVAQKSTLEITKINKADIKVEFKQNGKIGYFAGRVSAHAFYNNMFGLRISSDIGNDKKSNEENDKKEAATFTSKSNFKVSLAPIVKYCLNDKVSVHASLGGVYKNVKISTTDKHALKALDADKKHFFGFGGHLGADYNFNSKIAIFAEVSADKMLKKDNTFGKTDEGKFTTKGGFGFAGSFGVRAQLI